MSSPAAEFTVRVLTPEKVVFSGQTGSLRVPGITGEIGILAHHCRMLCRLKKGRVRIGEGEQARQVAISDGYLSVSGGAVEILAETAQMWIS